MAGIFYQPPNPNIGAQQPLAPVDLVPPQSGPPPQNPPFPGAAAMALVTIMSVVWAPPPPLPVEPVEIAPLVPAPVSSYVPVGTRVGQDVQSNWQVPPPGPYFNNEQPYAPKVLDPPISGPPPQNPPFPGAMAINFPTTQTVAWLPPQPQPIVAINLIPKLFTSDPPFPGAFVPQAVLVGWLPLPPDPFMGMGAVEPLEQTKFIPSGPTPQNPPVTGPNIGLRLEIQDAWLPPPPGPNQGAEQQFAQEVLSPPISGPPPQNPPFAGGAEVSEPVLISWLPPDPRPQWSPPTPISAIPNYPPPAGPVTVPGAVLVSWAPLPYAPQQSAPVPPPNPVPPSFITVGSVVPLAVLDSYDWAPRWPWARTPVITPSGPPAQNPPFPGTKVGVDVQNSWLPPQPAAIVGQQLFQGIVVQAFLPSRIPGLVETQVSWLPPDPAPILARNLIAKLLVSDPPFPGAFVPQPVAVWWSIPAPPQPQQAPIQAFQTPPPVQGAITVPYPVRSWWDLPPPMPLVAKNLNPPIAGPVPQNPPFMGGAAIPLAILVDWIPPPPMPPVAWTATQVFLPPPGANLAFDPRFLATPRSQYRVSSPQRTFVQITTPRPIITVTTPRVPGMPQGNDFSDAESTETVTNTWNFAPLLGTGVALTTPVTTTCALRSGVDSNPSSRLLSTPSIVSSPTTGAAAQAIRQQVSGLQPGACYILSATAATSDGQTLTVWAYQRGKTPS